MSCVLLRVRFLAAEKRRQIAAFVALVVDRHVAELPKNDRFQNAPVWTTDADVQKRTTRFRCVVDWTTIRALSHFLFPETTNDDERKRGSCLGAH